MKETIKRKAVVLDLAQIAETILRVSNPSHATTTLYRRQLRISSSRYT